MLLLVALRISLTTVFNINVTEEKSKKKNKVRLTFGFIQIVLSVPDLFNKKTSCPQLVRTQLSTFFNRTHYCWRKSRTIVISQFLDK